MWSEWVSTFGPTIALIAIFIGLRRDRKLEREKLEDRIKELEKFRAVTEDNLKRINARVFP